MKRITGLTAPIVDLITGDSIIENGYTMTPALLIANSLCRTRCAQPALAVEIATRLAKNADDEMDVEDSDFDMMVEAVTTDDMTTNFGKAAALRVLEDTESEEPPE